MKNADWLWPDDKRIAVVFNVCLEQWSDGKAPGISPMGNPLPAGVLDTMAISGEDAPDLVATAPVPAGFILRAKVEAVLGVIVFVFAPLLAVLAIASPWHALVAGAGIVIATTAATAIQLWFRSQAKRSQFRRRQVSSRVATFTEAFSSIGWAATAAVAAVSLVLALAPALMALLVLAGAWCMSPRTAHAS